MPTIKFFANLRNVAKTKELTVEGTSLRGVLNKMESEIPSQDGVILKGGQIHPHFVFTINGYNTVDFNVTVKNMTLLHYSRQLLAVDHRSIE